MVWIGGVVSGNVRCRCRDRYPKEICYASQVLTCCLCDESRIAYGRGKKPLTMNQRCDGGGFYTCRGRPLNGCESCALTSTDGLKSHNPTFLVLTPLEKEFYCQITSFISAVLGPGRKSSPQLCPPLGHKKPSHSNQRVPWPVKEG